MLSTGERKGDKYNGFYCFTFQVFYNEFKLLFKYKKKVIFKDNVT